MILSFIVVVSSSLNSESTTSTNFSPNNSAADYDFHQEDLFLDTNFFHRVWMDLTTGDEITIHFETATVYQGLEYFICDQTNMDLWNNGLSASVYNFEEDMHYLWDTFTAP